MNNIVKMADYLKFAGKTDSFKTITDLMGHPHQFQLIHYQSRLSNKTYKFWEPVQGAKNG